MGVVFDNVLPVFAVMALGAAIKRLGLAGDSFFRTAERLAYFVFFPALLFYKIGGPADGLNIDWSQSLAVLTTVFLVFGLSLLAIKLQRIPANAAGSFAQCSFRFNTYVGMVVIMTALGPAGVTNFGLLIGLVIPFINLLAVGSLIWFGSGEYSTGRKLVLMTKAIIANPLILACAAGIAYAAWMPPWPLFVGNTLSLFSVLSLPLALIAIGGTLSLDKLRGNFRWALAASVLKLAVKPVIGCGLLLAFGVSGVSFATAMLFFATPSAPSAYILSSQLGSDPDLAAAAIVLSTLLSFFSLSLVLMLLA